MICRLLCAFGFLVVVLLAFGAALNAWDWVKTVAEAWRQEAKR
jgi:hypothetical protein